MDKPYREELEEWARWASDLMALPQIRSGKPAETSEAIRKCQKWIKQEIENAEQRPQ